MTLSASALVVRHGEITALAGVDACCEPGKVLAVVGRNGSGKSTLLRVLAGLQRPTAGSVRLDDRTLAEMQALERARRLAFVPQRPSLCAPFTVREVVALGTYARGEDLPAIERAMERLAIRDFALRRYHELSMGQRQRVVLARALAQHTQGGAILLDEPFSALDPGGSRDCANCIREVAKEGAMVVVALHDLPLADAIADEVLLLDAGTVAASGPPAEVLDPGRLERHFGGRFIRLGVRLASLYD